MITIFDNEFIKLTYSSWLVLVRDVLLLFACSYLFIEILKFLWHHPYEPKVDADAVLEKHLNKLTDISLNLQIDDQVDQAVARAERMYKKRSSRIDEALAKRDAVPAYQNKMCPKCGGRYGNGTVCQFCGVQS